MLKEYTAYSPKMFAGISEIDDVLQDRTVRIPLLCKKDDEIVQRQFKEEQREDAPKYTFTLIKEPFIDSRFRGNDKYESAQLS